MRAGGGALVPALLLGLVCFSHALLVPQRAAPKLAPSQPARPKSPLRCPRLSMFAVESSSSTVVACAQRKPADEGVFGQEKVGSLGQYLSELTSAQLATALESRLSHLITAAPSPSNPNAVVVALRESFYFGPRMLHLWIKPRLVLNFRKQAHPAPSIQCASTCETDADFSERLRLAQLELNCWCTWWEEGLPHRQGNAVPCLLLNSRMRLNFQQLRRAIGPRTLTSPEPNPNPNPNPSPGPSPSPSPNPNLNSSPNPNQALGQLVAPARDTHGPLVRAGQARDISPYISLHLPIYCSSSRGGLALTLTLTHPTPNSHPTPEG